MNRLGHCESYDFGLELETTMASCRALDETSTYLTPQIICGEGIAVFHSEWDNLNKITTNVHGSNVINSAGGIMIQAPDAIRSVERTLPLYDRSKKRSLKLDTPVTLPPVTIYNRESPTFPENTSFSLPDDKVYTDIIQEYYVWFMCKMILSKGRQEVPALAGFISATGVMPSKKSTIDY